MAVWYQVGDLEVGLSFYRDTLGMTEEFVDEEGRWARLHRGLMQVVVGEREPQEPGVAVIDVADVKAEAERLRAAGVEVGVVVELHGQMRLLDVYDPDGNRIQLAQELS